MGEATPGIALIAYEDLHATVHTWARLAVALGRLGARPLYVGGLRRPTAGEMTRIAAASGRWAPAPSGPDADGVTHVTPLDLPAQRFGTARRWDRRSLETAITRHAPTGWVIVFSSAIGKPWPEPPGWRVCYFPVDEFALGDARYAEREERMLERCDLFISVTESVVAPRRSRVPAAEVLPNGYDPELFRAGTAPSADLAAIPRPRVGYVGTLSASKVDFPLVARLARARPQVQFVLAGPAPDPAALDPVRELPNVHVVRERPRAEVAGVYAALDACLLPYRDTPMNRACSPLKAREALALGVPVISTQVDELAEHPGAAHVCATDDGLLALLDRLADGSLGIDPVAARWFVDATWEVRARELMATLRRHGAAS